MGFFVKFGLISDPANPGFAMKALSNYLSNFTISMALQATRLGIVSMDKIYDTLTSVHFWGISALMGAVISFSSFSWSQQVASIDQIKNPVAKMMARRLMEIRSLLTGRIAPSSKLIQPDVYGWLPWVYTAANGLVGMLVFFKSERLVTWVENQKIFAAFQDQYNKLDRRIESYLTQWLGPIRSRQCSRVFLR